MTVEEVAEKQNNEDFEQYQVDPDTGEMIMSLDEGRSFVVEDLPKIARQIRYLMRRVSMVEKYRDDELSRIGECCTSRIDTIQRQVDFLTERAQQLAGDERVEYPGLGVFRTVKGREYVDDQAYQAMMPESQLHLQSQHQGCFRKKTTVSPDKKAIMALLKDIAEGRSECELSGFVIIRKPDRFEFKPEEGE